MSLLSRFRWWIIPAEIKDRLYFAELRAKECPIKSIPELIMAEEASREAKEALEECIRSQSKRIDEQVVTIIEKNKRLAVLEHELSVYNSLWELAQRKLRAGIANPEK